MKRISKLIKENKNLSLILLIAIILRFVGINHGYPYIFNFDEPTTVRSTIGLFFSPSIDHFDWPHFSYYLHFLFYFTFVKLRGLIQIVGFDVFLKSIFPFIWNDPFIFYLISRSITALFGAFTVIPIYLTGKLMYSRKVGIVSALFLAMYPFHVYLSHFTMQDVSLLFWITWAIYFSYKSSLNPSIKNFILAGIFVGFAASIKYNAALIGFILPIFILINYNFAKKEISVFRVVLNLIISGLISIIIFLILNHRVILDWDLFWSYEYGKGFLWQLKENAEPLSLQQYFPHLVENLWKMLIDSGISIFILFLLSIFYIKDKKFSKLNIAMYTFALFNILLISRYGRSTSHYYIPTYSFIILLAGYTFFELKKYFSTKLFLVLVFTPIIFINILFMGKLLKKDSRYIAYQNAQAMTDEIYYKGNSIGEFNAMNNLGIKSYKEDDNNLKTNSIIMSETILLNDDYVLIMFIDAINRNGTKIYVYRKN